MFALYTIFFFVLQYHSLLKFILPQWVTVSRLQNVLTYTVSSVWFVIKVPTPDSFGECFTFNYYSLLPQQHIYNLSCKTGKNLDEINYSKYISSYRKKKSKETRSTNITSWLTILQAREKSQRTAPKISYLFQIFMLALSY